MRKIGGGMEDHSDYIYPKVATPSRLCFQSHAEFLQAGSLRYAISKAVHDLTISELQMVLELIQMAKIAAEQPKAGA